MKRTVNKAVAIVGVGAVLPDAPDAKSFWQNVKNGRYSITDVTPDRWDVSLYYDPDPKVPDKSYSKIGGWVRDWQWEPLKWRLPIPPRVSDGMDLTQKWAIIAVREALRDYGYPERSLNPERTAVILGNAMGGDTHLYTAARILFPETLRELRTAESFASLPAEQQQTILAELRQRVGKHFAEITEDTMPGELSNVTAGRIAALFDFKGMNYVTDAACASAMAAMSAAVEGLEEEDYDLVVTGGIDANMSASTYVKFCKIGALSATGTRPYAEGADGFVMGEGSVIFLLKRLADAERDGDHIYAVIRGLGGSSDGKGKGITAPNPVGQRLAVLRGWENAGLSPASATLIEGHGTSTRVGDVAEVQSLNEVFANLGLQPGSIPLGSVKSNIGHLKGAAGAAGILKTMFALHEKMLPPSLNFDRPNPGIDFVHSPFYINTQLQPWERKVDGVRRAGVSAFGFGGTNFHAVLEEYVAGRIKTDNSESVAVGERPVPKSHMAAAAIPTPAGREPLRGALVLGANSENTLIERLKNVLADAEAGRAPSLRLPLESDLRAPLRLAIDYGDAAELATKCAEALKAFSAGQIGRWKALRARGIFLGRGPKQKVAFLFTGQGSQYANMLRELREREPIVAATFAEADAVMTPLLDKPLTEYIFVDNTARTEQIALAEEGLRQTAITQPAVLATDTAIARMLASYGIVPDMVMGHSLGEYGALVAAGVLSFADALKAVSARANEMNRFSVDDNGMMAAVFGPLDEIERILAQVDGYVVIANINSSKEAVIGGASVAVERAMAAVRDAGFVARQLSVSHAFHTQIVAPASEPLAEVLRKMPIQSPRLPIVANVNGEFYPTGPAYGGVVPAIVDLLAKQVASPVQFVKGLNTLYSAGARAFVEVGPKRVLYGFVEDVLRDKDEVSSLFTNHPRIGDVVSFNYALCGLYAAGFGAGVPEEVGVAPVDGSISGNGHTKSTPAETPQQTPPAPTPIAANQPTLSRPAGIAPVLSDAERNQKLGQLFAEFMQRGLQLFGGASVGQTQAVSTGNVCISGAALGLPGTEHIFADGNIERILRGDQFIDVIPLHLRRAMAEKNITRLVKSEAGARFETISNLAEVIKLAARGQQFDLFKEFGFPEDRIPALDWVTKLAIAAGIDALCDAGIPLVMRYKTTTRNTQLPDRWQLPEALRDDTGVIMASAFPGLDSFSEIQANFYNDKTRRERLKELLSLREKLTQISPADHAAIAEIDNRVAVLRADLEKDPFIFDRRFLFRVLSMGHSQFAEYIGARGPNTQINSACASTTQAIALARDWILANRCRRVIVISADDVTSENMLEWFGSGFLASGTAATDEAIEDAALPFDRRRHGLIIGMGAAALVVESPDATRERGIQPICEILGTVTANSAFHGSRLDVNHIGSVMEKLVAEAEAHWGISRYQFAPEMVFVSHETYTPARGGSASAEVYALRQVFGSVADQIVVANTKGCTGHPMGVGIEDVVAVKILETGMVPPVANFKEIDPELGMLNLSKGGVYPVRYALRLGAGFGSQISMSLIRWVPTADGKHRTPNTLGFDYRLDDHNAWKNWLRQMSGYDTPEVEVYKRTLRIKDRGPVQRGADVPMPPQQIPTPQPITVKTPHRGVSTVAETGPEPSGAAAAPIPTSRDGQVDPVQEKVLQLVAEKTGYPRDMLDLDLDLEADLGIDTVKQAEMFAAIRAAYDIPRDDNLKLRDFPTLAHTIQFVYDHRPDLQPKSTQAPTSTVATPPVTLEMAPPPAEANGGVPDPVQEKVLQLISEKTGYPRDMLDLDLDLEADLGIDTVKQAEMFAAVRETYGIPRDDSLQLREFNTLAHVIKFVYDRRPDLQKPIVETSRRDVSTRDVSTAVPSVVPSGFIGSMEAANRIPRRVPVAVLRPPLDLCKATGVTLDANSRVVVMPDRGGVGKALIAKLHKLGVTVLTIPNDGEAPDAETLTSQMETWLTEGPIHGVYWLPALDQESPISEMDLETWREATRVRVKLLFATMRALYGQIDKSGTFLLSATRLGGRHGYDDAGAVAPLGGAVTGFTKTYKREHPAALVKAVDFAVTRKTTALTELLVAETLFDPGVVEVGYAAGQRWSVGLAERSLQAGATPDFAGLQLDKDSVFVITGAAGSIVSAITADLAAASGGVFYLLDLAPKPDPQNTDLKRFATDKANLKRDIFQRLKDRGERATPALVEKEIARLERVHAANSAIQAVERSGGAAQYYSLNLLDPQAVGKVMHEIARKHGRIDVLVHAAGLEISHLLPDKKPQEFDLVFDVKSDGWFNLMAGAGEMSIGAAVVFSSIAGRFGNAGQTDYSAANDLLCKSVSNFRTSRPESRGIAIDWTAWGGIGMASRGSIPTVMKQAGIDMLPPEAGIPIVRRELTAPGMRGEVVIAGRLGVMLDEFDATGGLDPARIAALAGKGNAQGIMSQPTGIVGMGLYSGLTIETTLDPAEQPFLHDHQIGGTPVLPGVMGIEALAEAAKLLFPDRHVGIIEQVNFLLPFKFYRGEKRTISTHADFRMDGDAILADCRLTGSRLLHGETTPQVTTHFTACVRLVKSPLSPLANARPIRADGNKFVAPAEVYRLYFHGPAYQVIDKAWRVGDEVIGQFASKLPANHQPPELTTLVAPRLIELCFQTAGLWEMGQKAKMGLPYAIDQLTLLRPVEGGKARLYAVVKPAEDGSFAAQVVDAQGKVYLTMQGYRTVELPERIDAEQLLPLQEALQG